jgi:hypothetical protein
VLACVLEGVVGDEEGPGVELWVDEGGTDWLELVGVVVLE